MDGDDLHEPAHALHLCAPRARELPHHPRVGRVRGQPHPRKLQRACDWCGARSGRDWDKWAECGLTAAPAASLELAPVIAQSPVNIECKVTEVKELGSHHMFLASVEAVQVEDSLLDESGRLDLGRAGLTAYSHGEYFDLGKRLGTFGYSVRKKASKKKH